MSPNFATVVDPVVDLTPGSAEWLKRLTGSRFGRLMRGPDSWPALRRDMLSEARGGTFANGEHGQENEPRACAMYEILTGRELMSPGFRELPGNPRVGCTVDRLSSCGRVLEVKCPLVVGRHLLARAGIYDAEYTWQLQGGIWVWEADEGDFVSFCEDPSVPLDDQCIIVPTERDDRAIAKLAESVDRFFDWFDSPRAVELPTHSFIQPGAASVPKLF